MPISLYNRKEKGGIKNEKIYSICFICCFGGYGEIGRASCRERVSSAVFTLGNNNKYRIYNNDSDNIKILKNSSSNNGENLKIDKEDALKLAQIYYKKLYNKDYATNEFGIVYNDVWKCWNVYLEKNYNDFVNNNKDTNYDGKYGVFISDENGGLLADFGDDYK